MSSTERQQARMGLINFTNNLWHMEQRALRRKSETQMKRIIGISGMSGSGKSACADVLVQEGFIRMKQADPLKDMLRSLLRAQNLPPAEIERRIEGDLKNEPDALLMGKSPRHAMQTLGTEWGRQCLAPNFWSEAWKQRAMATNRSVVCDDIRFPEEVTALRALGGKVIRVIRPGLGRVNDHVSEDFDGIDPDITIINEGTVEELTMKVSMVVRSAYFGVAS